MKYETEFNDRNKLTLAKVQQISDEMRGRMAGIVNELRGCAATVELLKTHFVKAPSGTPPIFGSLPVYVDEEVPAGFIRMRYGSGSVEFVKLHD